MTAMAAPMPTLSWSAVGADFLLKSVVGDDLYVAGYASVDMVDKQGDRIPTAALKKAFGQFMSNKAFRNVQLAHSGIQVGEVVDNHTDSDGRMWKSEVDDHGLFVVCRIRSDIQKVLIIGCKRTMDDVCIGCSRCLVAFNRRDGEFARYKDTDAQLIGLLNCGDCPGASIVPRLAQMNLWNKPMEEKVTKIHFGPCVTDHCMYKETLMDKVKATAAVEVIPGTHPYRPENIFAFSRR